MRYASVPRILQASGHGSPDADSVEQRRRLRDLCRQYRVPLWMTEVSHAEVDPRSFDHLRGRAIHIHDEMAYADDSALYGMNAMWDKNTHADHFAGRGGEVPNSCLTEEDTIALADNDTNSVLITGTGYAIGHYARWLKQRPHDGQCAEVTALCRRLISIPADRHDHKMANVGAWRNTSSERNSSSRKWDWTLAKRAGRRPAGSVPGCVTQRLPGSTRTVPCRGS